MACIHIAEREALFLHIPKTAGYSVTGALERAFPDAHRMPTRGLGRRRGAADFVARKIGATAFERNWTFCVVRNPWDWAVSGYLHVTRNRPAYGDAPPSFADFMRGAWRKGLKRNPNRLKFNSPELYVYYHTQIDQLAHLRFGWLGRRAPVDFFVRFERLAEDWSVVCDRLGSEAALPHRNRSERRHYASYYDGETRAMVEKRNAELIERFGYKFDE
jgi:hypothetical protein